MSFKHTTVTEHDGANYTIDEVGEGAWVYTATGPRDVDDEGNEIVETFSGCVRSNNRAKAFIRLVLDAMRSAWIQFVDEEPTPFDRCEEVKCPSCSGTLHATGPNKMDTLVFLECQGECGFAWVVPKGESRVEKSLRRANGAAEKG